MNSGPICNSGFVPITTSWQDCQKAAEHLGHAVDSLALIEPGSSFGTSKPPGCFQSDEDGLFYFNKDVVDTTAIGTDKILCVIKGSDHLPTVAPYILIMAILNTNISIVAHYIIQAIALAIRTSLLMDGGIVEENGHQRTPLCPFAMLICRRLALMLSIGTLKGQQGIHGRHVKIDFGNIQRFLHTYARVTRNSP